MNVLGIETSCDETSAAIVADGARIVSNVVSSQVELHRPYGGVVPELASRNHLQLIDEVIRQAIAGHDYDAVAATYGPGLASSLLIGLNAGKGIAYATGKPFLGINHMEAHLYSPLLESGSGLSAATAAGRGTEATPTFPLVSLIVSGGHTILVHATGIGQHRILGQTIDDAAGEAFDKVAKLLKLGYPGGPEIDRLAKSGHPAAIPFPRSLPDSYDFSFSGLKTSVLYYLRKREGEASAEPPASHQTARQEPRPPRNVADICASFQEAVVDVLVNKLIRAAEEYRVQTVSASGGVSINSRFREKLAGECQRRGLQLLLAPPNLCTDNAAMIAALAFHKLQAGQRRDFSLEVAPSVGLGVAA